MLNKKVLFIILFIIIIISILVVFILKIDIKELVTNKKVPLVNEEVLLNKETSGSLIINKEIWTFQSSLWWGWR